MSTTTPAQPPAGAPVGRAFYGHVHAYAQEVRAHLADLRPDQVEELADGLEADLAEAVVDAPGALPRRAPAPASSDGAPAGTTGTDGTEALDDTGLDLVAFFGPPAEYAAELRTAAGLPPLAPGAARGPRPGLRRRLTGLGEMLAADWRAGWQPVTSSPHWASTAEFLRALTPAWWILRGWVVATLLLALVAGYQVAVLPPDLSARVVVLIAVVVSVQWGRGRWLPTRGLRKVGRPLSVAAAVAAVPAVLVAASASASSPYAWDRGYEQGRSDASSGLVSSVSFGSGDSPGTAGVWVDGAQVSNLFVYDAAGEPLRDVQVFDDRGRQVRTVTEEGASGAWAVPDVEGAWYFQPAVSTDGRERWNVYPLRAVAEEDVEYPEGDGRPVPATGTRTRDMPWPFLQAPTAVPSSVGTGETSGTGGAGEAPADEPAEGDPAPSQEAPATPPAGGVAPAPTGPTPVVGAIG